MFECVHLARRFDSEHRYLVFAELPSGRRLLCGRTPSRSRDGVRIPEHVTWWVRPIGRVDDRGLLLASEVMHELVTDLQDHDIPGLDLEHSDVDGRALVDLDGRAQLRWLNLCRCPGINDAALACVSDLRRLRHLFLAHCAGITDAGMRYLARLSELGYLDLDGCDQIGALGLARLAALSRLAMLSMRGCPRVDDHALDEVARIRGLEWLDVSDCPGVTDAGLLELASSRRLAGSSLVLRSPHHCGA